MAVALSFLLAACGGGSGDSSGGGSDDAKEFDEYVLIDGTKWHGKVNITYEGKRYNNVDVYVKIGYSNDYSFEVPIDSNFNDNGTYSRNHNKAALTSYRYGNIGSATFTSRTEMVLKLNDKSGVPGTYTLYYQ